MLIYQLNLSGTYSVQNAIFAYLNKSLVRVTCFFAVSAPASSCLVIFENSYFQLSFNGTIQRPLNLQLSATGFIDIPQEIVQQGDLSIAVFDAKIYDVNKNGNIMAGPAVEQKGALVIELFGEESISAYMTLSSTGK